MPLISPYRVVMARKMSMFCVSKRGEITRSAISKVVILQNRPGCATEVAPTVFRSLSSALCPPPSAFRSLHTPYCLLPTALYSLRFTGPHLSFRKFEPGKDEGCS